MKYLYSAFILLAISINLSKAQQVNSTEDGYILNGVPWYDDRGSIVNAHGACIVEDNGRYYLFGEYKSNDINGFYGFSCYSSDDLVNWKFERIVLGIQPDGILGPDRIGERVKVMKCPSTGEYVMYMHCDDKRYNDPHIGYATSSTINGEYTFHGALLHNGEPIRRWDMGTFQDADGVGYLLIHHGIIYRLSKDYKTAEKRLPHISDMGESPAMFKKDGHYYLLSSNLTSWERNDNKYHTATSIEGPWTLQGLFCPEGTLTFNSQCSFVLPVVRDDNTIYMYMGDRWAYPHQADAATQIWLPITADNGKMSIPEYWNAWDFKTIKKVDPLAAAQKIPHEKVIVSNKKDWDTINGKFTSNEKGCYLEVPFKGRQIAITGETNDHGAFAVLKIYDKKQEVVHSSFVDFYSKVPDSAIRFKSPELPYGNYTLKVEVTGNMSEWFKKDGTRFGSKDTFIVVTDFFILK